MSYINKILSRKAKVSKEDNTDGQSTDETVVIDPNETPKIDGEDVVATGENKEDDSTDGSKEEGSENDNEPSDGESTSDEETELTEEADVEITDEEESGDTSDDGDDNEKPSDENDGNDTDDKSEDKKSDDEKDTKDEDKGDDENVDPEETAESLESYKEVLMKMIHNGDTTDTTLALIQSATSFAIARTGFKQSKVAPSMEEFNYSATSRRLALNVFVSRLDDLVRDLRHTR